MLFLPFLISFSLFIFIFRRLFGNIIWVSIITFFRSIILFITFFSWTIKFLILLRLLPIYKFSIIFRANTVCTFLWLFIKIFLFLFCIVINFRIILIIFCIFIKFRTLFRLFRLFRLFTFLIKIKFKFKLIFMAFLFIRIWVLTFLFFR